VFNKIIYVFGIIFSSFFLISCSDTPTDLGSDLLNQDDVEVLKIDSSIDSVFQKSSFVKRVIPLSASDILILGKANNITAHSLINFTFFLPDTIKTDIRLGKIKVLESYIDMVKSYSFGEESAAFDYEVYKIKSAWGSTTFTSDSLDGLDVDKIDISFNRSIIADTLFRFNFDTTLASSWLKFSVDTTLGENEGILLNPKPESQKIVGFTAFNINGVDDPKLFVVVEKAGVKDTLKGLVIADVSVAIGELPQVSAENIAIQSSLTSVGKLFFDLSSIPPFASISSAKLTLTVDTLETKTGSNFNNALRLFLLTDSTTINIDDVIFSTMSRTGETFTGDVTAFVRAWRSSLENQGFLIKAAGELRGIELFAIKNSNVSDKNKRPKLEIVYSRVK
jgi:hypothetical protein